MTNFSPQIRSQSSPKPLLAPSPSISAMACSAVSSLPTRIIGRARTLSFCCWAASW
jgi:hypothetical protein